MRILFTLSIILLSVSMVIAGTITGKVISKDKGEPLAGANVYLQGTTVGAATDADGKYTINAADGTYNMVCDYVGFAKQTISIGLSGNFSQDFELVEYLFAKTIDVLADRAKERETPVAYSNINKEAMEVQLGSRDIPMVLNTTPSVYATPSGGGAGDARINVRGFNQRNVAIMINGVPVNDMENGWVYWSNWDGVGDATSSIQIQRGLSAVNLATPSIGGTMNILTDPASQESGLKFKQEFGDGSFIKSTLFGHTGLIDGKYAVSAGIVRKIGDGLVDKTWTDAWAYYFGASYNINKDNRIEFYALGAPQRHGQNLYKQNLATYDKAYAEELIDESMKSTDSDNDGTSDWDEYFEKFPEQGRKYNQNWAPVSSSYKGKQAVENSTFDRYDSESIMERENFFHKPQVNFNWYSNVSNKMSLHTVAYFSGGTGGGTGTLGDFYRRDANGILGDDDYKFYYGPNPWVFDINETIAMNSAAAGSYWVDRDSLYKEDGQSLGILRNSRNNQWTIGLISKANYKISDNVITTIGFDWRTAEIEHYREVRDLLGGEYYVDDSDEFNSNKRVGLGDKIAYNFTNTVDWLGTFAQAEYTKDQITGYGMFGYSMIKYNHTNHFLNDGGKELERASDWINGLQTKGGLSYRLTSDLQIYGNAGYVSKVTIFDAVINDQTGDLVENEGNEIFTSFEVGSAVRLLDGQLNLKGNFYTTNWSNRTLTQSDYDQFTDEEGIIVVTGLDAQHTGVEFEVAYQPLNMLRFDAAASIGNWENTSDADAMYKDYGTRSDTSFTIYTKDLKTGDAPQTQLALGTSVFPIQGLMIQGVYRYYSNHYADWNGINRDDATDREQSWKAPNYGVLEFHASYDLPVSFSGLQFQVFAHLFNALDEVYVMDAVDNSQYNAWTGDGKNHKADDAEIFLGLPRYFNIGVNLIY